MRRILLSSTGLSNDLYQFDTGAFTWTDLWEVIAGTFPTPRSSPALLFSDLENKLYLFGGLSSLQTNGGEWKTQICFLIYLEYKSD